MTEALFMVAGVVIFGAGWLTGRFARLRSRPAPVRPICECGHHHGTHGGRGCNAQVEKNVRDAANITGYSRRWFPCACLHYTGPIPLSMDWVPPIATSE